MNNSGFDYLMNKSLGDNSKLALYYDFNSGSAYSEGAGTSYTGYLKSVHPSKSAGNHNMILPSLTSTTSTGALFSVTGTFLNAGDSGDFSISNGKITGTPNFKLNNCTFLFSTKKTKQEAGLIFGSLKKIEQTEDSVDYKYSSGINIGINARNKLFVNGIGDEGEYVLTANDIELANKNICSVSIGGDSINFARYDLGLNEIDEQSYPVQTSLIQTDTNQVGFVGGGDTVDFFRPGGNYSGIIDRLAIFSGVIDTDSCLYMASGWNAELDYQAPGTKNVEVTTGYQNEIIYNTGYTGVQVLVTGNFAEKTGWVTKTFGIDLHTGSGVFEGSLFKTGTALQTGFLDVVLESQGLVVDDLLYNPTGDSAEATLGLDNTASSLINTGVHSISFATPTTTGVIQVFASGLTGFVTGEPTGSIKTAIKQTITITGEETHAIIPSTGRMFEYKYDSIYFKDERSFDLYDYSIHTGLFAEKGEFNLKGERGFDSIGVETNSPLTIKSSLNSQTVFETKPQVKNIGFNVAVSNTGDFYITGFLVKLQSDFNTLDQKEFLYNVSQTGNVRSSIGDSGTLQTGFMRNISSGMSGQEFVPEIFLNGQKLYSGLNYTRVNDTYVWIDNFDATGRMFSYQQPTGIQEFVGTGQTDISGNILFNKGLSSLFINGMEQKNSIFLETSSVTPIKTGFAAILPQTSGFFSKFSLTI